MLELGALFWITAVITVILVGIAKAGFGGGPGAIATPLLSLVMPVPEAAALLLPILIVADIFSVQHYYKQVHVPSLRALLPGALAGILLGSLFFHQFSDDERVLKMGIGIIAVGFVLYQGARSRLMRSLAASRPSLLKGSVWGTIAGFTSTLAHVGGPPAAIYLLPQQLRRNLFVGTTAVLFFIINVVKLIPYAWLGLLQIGNLPTILLLLPFAFIGVKLGILLNRRFTDTWFNRVVHGLLLLVGIQLILGQSLVGLLLN